MLEARAASETSPARAPALSQLAAVRACCFWTWAPGPSGVKDAILAASAGPAATARTARVDRAVGRMFWGRRFMTLLLSPRVRHAGTGAPRIWTDGGQIGPERPESMRCQTALDSYRAKRDLDRTPEPGGGARRRRRGQPVRDPGAPRVQPALGPAAGARGRAGLLGAAQGRAHPPGREPPGGAHRGPPAGVPGVPRRDPRRLLRRRDHGDLGLAAPTRPRSSATRRSWSCCTASACRAATCCSPRAGKDWMIHRMDPPEPGVEPMPEDVKPMMAKVGALPARRGRAGRTRSSGTACARWPTWRPGT